MSFLWTSEDLVAAMGGRPLGPMPEGIGGISIDSRSLEPGDAFFAIKGEAM
ncbi:MAG: UDP-N-acetylmuramoylalanyl-D-glutamyl-2, 6-diaminopimelate--D-alanyl-D-alanine ligase, partial [Mesorhizobium sp.]